MAAAVSGEGVLESPEDGETVAEVREGVPFPLGPRRTAGGMAFSVVATGAAGVRLVLDPAGPGRRVLRLDSGRHRSGDVWHVEVAGLASPVDFAWIVEDAAGALGPELLDPYAHGVAGAERWGEVPSPERRWRSVAIEDAFDWQGTRAPRHRATDRVIYELGVRGFTRHESSGVAHPGTFRGLIEKIPYLVDLGVTTVELLPVFEWDEDEVGRDHLETGERLRNLWGYSPLTFAAPKVGLSAAGSAGGALLELKELVREMHRAGLEVLFDVVFNHTGEGELDGSRRAVSLAGLAPDLHFLFDEAGEALDFTGCGNTLRAAHPAAQDVVVDALRFWAGEVKVDGFRFDLASALTRGDDGHALAEPSLIRRIGDDPLLAHRFLVAEAWDAGGLYQVGDFPHWGPWAEWNGPFRDDVRRFVRGDAGLVRALVSRLLGSPDLFRVAGSPASSVNYVACHDGFTLGDLVSYERKHNWANGEHDRDGSDHCHSWNHGPEGPSDDPRVLALRRRQVRNLLTLLFVAQGVPMIQAGDEMGRSQRGNNNAWCQDNPLGWVDWAGLEDNQDLYRFVRGLIALRRALPVLRHDHFPGETGASNGQAEVVWHGVRPGHPDLGPGSRSLALELRGGEEGADVYLATNSWREPLVFEPPPPPPGRRWRLAVDTFAESGGQLFLPGEGPAVGDTVRLEPSSCLVLVATPAP